MLKRQKRLNMRRLVAGRRTAEAGLAAFHWAYHEARAADRPIVFADDAVHLVPRLGLRLHLALGLLDGALLPGSLHLACPAPPGLDAARLRAFLIDGVVGAEDLGFRPGALLVAPASARVAALALEEEPAVRARRLHLLPLPALASHLNPAGLLLSVAGATLGHLAKAAPTGQGSAAAWLLERLTRELDRMEAAGVVEEAAALAAEAACRDFLNLMFRHGRVSLIELPAH